MIGEWCYYESFLTKQACENIIKISSEINPKEAAVGGPDGTKPHEMRKSVVRFMDMKNPRYEQLNDLLWKLAIQANEKFFNFHISKLDYVQVAEYDSSYKGKYEKHHDIFWINNDPKYHRKLSAIIQLTDPAEYEGGDFEFFNLVHYPDKDKIRKQGTILFFPSFLEHQATTVTKGKRHSLAAWFDGPKWR
jgi:PKHD-type hydroxylase